MGTLPEGERSGSGTGFGHGNEISLPNLMKHAIRLTRFTSLPPTRRGLVPWYAACLLSLASPLLAADKLDRVLDEQTNIQQEATRSQKRIDALDDETRRLLAEYRQLQADVDNLRRYNEQMRRIVSAQEAELDDLEVQMAEVETTQQRILPLTVDMVDALEAFIAADTPFLREERSLRIAGLRELLDMPDTSIAEKYRRVLEAYRIEADYAYNIEAYTGELSLELTNRTVDYLRLGRTGLYYLSLDRREAGIWDPATDAWHRLDERYLDGIQQAIRVARKQATPELLTLPVRAAEMLP